MVFINAYKSFLQRQCSDTFLRYTKNTRKLEVFQYSTRISDIIISKLEKNEEDTTNYEIKDQIILQC